MMYAKGERGIEKHWKGGAPVLHNGVPKFLREVPVGEKFKTSYNDDEHEVLAAVTSRFELTVEHIGPLSAEEVQAWLIDRADCCYRSRSPESYLKLEVK